MPEDLSDKYPTGGQSQSRKSVTRRNTLRMAIAGATMGVAGCSSGNSAQDGRDETMGSPTETRADQEDGETTGSPTETGADQEDGETTATPTERESTAQAAWPGTLGGPGNTCVGTGVLQPEPELDWTFDTGEFVPRSPTVADGRIHVVGERFDSGSYVTKAIALSAENGDVEWEQVLYEQGSTPEPATSAPTVADGTVYVVTSSQLSDGRAFVALDAATGEVKWELAGAAGDHYGGPVAHGDAVVEMATETADGDFALRSFADGGTLQWTNPLGDRAPWVTGLAAGDDAVAVVADDIMAIDAATGETRWTVSRDELDARPHLPPVIHDGSVYVATGLGGVSGRRQEVTYRLLSFSLADGSRNWQTELTTRDDRTAIPQGPFAVTDESVILVQGENSRTGECEVVTYRNGDAVTRTEVGAANESLGGVTVSESGSRAYVPYANGVYETIPAEGSTSITGEISLSPEYLQNWGLPVVGGRFVLAETSRIVAVE